MGIHENAIFMRNEAYSVVFNVKSIVIVDTINKYIHITSGYILISELFKFLSILNHEILMCHAILIFDNHEWHEWTKK